MKYFLKKTKQERLNFFWSMLLTYFTAAWTDTTVRANYVTDLEDNKECITIVTLFEQIKYQNISKK